jgi:GntR family transcriptional regulator
MPGELDLRVDRGTGIPLGAQLAGSVRAAVKNGALAPGDRVPSVRELADIAGVNVNTARAVYARLESEGLVRSEQGRGTFVETPRSDAPAPSRRQLREQIAALEATLARLPPPPLAGAAEERRPGAALLSTNELLDVRDRLLERLEQLDTERTALLESLEQLGFETSPAPAAASDTPTRRATPSLAGARIRWVGA